MVAGLPPLRSKTMEPSGQTPSISRRIHSPTAAPPDPSVTTGGGGKKYADSAFRGRRDIDKRELAPSLKVSFSSPLDKAHIAGHVWEAP